MRQMGIDDVAISTFKVDLPAEHDLRKSLTKKPVKSVHQLMDRIDKYKWVKEDQQQGKWKAKVIPQDMRDFGSDKYNNNRPQRDFAEQSGPTATQVVGTVFRKPMHQVLERIKNEPYFKLPNKMVGDPMKHNSLPIPLGVRAHHRRLQNFMELFRAVGQRREVREIFISSQWARGLGRIGISERYFFKCPFWHN